MIAANPDLDRDLADLRANSDRWARLAVQTKRRLLAEVKSSVGSQAARWACAAADAKGIAGTPLEGEEWISGPWAVLFALTRYIRTLDQIARYGSPRIEPDRIRTRSDGRTVANVFPVTAYDRLLLSGVSAEVWMQDGVTPESLDSTLGVFYHEPDPRGRVALVLGAGNIASIGPLDVLYKLIADGCVCILKANPVNDYLAPIWSDALAPLIREGYLRVVTGGADVGEYLCQHPGVDEIHITGSDRTHDAIVFGADETAAQRKQRNDPVLDKPISSELGNVSPTIVVPGPWSEADFRFQAEHIVTQKLHNAGFNCIASQVLILPEEWDGTPRLLSEIERVLRERPRRPQYYPGAGERHRALTEAHSAVDGTGTLIRVDANDRFERSFGTEAFCDVLATTALPGDIESFLSRAADFANDRLRGTLGANLIIHPATEREYPAAVDQAIAHLRYGCIGINAWTGVGYFVAETPWGAYPGHTLADVGSGIGVVHNAHLFSRSLKSIVRAPFAPFPRSLFGYGGALLPRPPWFVTNAMAARIGRALCDFEAAPSAPRAAAIAALAMRG
jgi:aldehyde dehydrogenase (NAD(P)+)